MFHRNKENLAFHLSMVSLSELNIIKTKYINLDPEPGSSKYLNYEIWIPKFIKYTIELNLNNSKPINILDLGSGPGYFGFVCQNYKHNVRTLDLPDNPIYNELVDLFGVERTIYRINAFEKIPTFDIKFDLVTAFAICFNNHATDKLWGVKEWDYFISDIKDNATKKNARIFLEFNQESDGLYFPKELYEYFISINAIIKNNSVLINF